MAHFLLLLSVGLGVSKNMISKRFGGASDNIARLLKANIVTSIIACLVFGLGIWQNSGRFPAERGILFLLGGGYGVCTFLSQLLYFVSLQEGSVAVCSMIYSCGFIIPTVFASAVYHEAVTLGKAAGILFLILCILAVSLPTQKVPQASKKSGKAWLLPALGAMAASGAVGILQKIVRNSYSAWSLDVFLFFAFAVMLIFSVVILFCLKTNAKASKTDLIQMALIAVCTVFANRINLYLPGVIAGILFFPCVNGGTIVLSAVASRIFFHERLSRLKWAGIFFSFVAVILIVL